MQKKVPGNKSVAIHLAIYKICITACFAIIFSLFLFACESSRNSSNSEGTDTTSSAPMQTDTSSMPADTSSMRPDTTNMP